MSPTTKKTNHKPEIYDSSGLPTGARTRGADTFPSKNYHHRRREPAPSGNKTLWVSFFGKLRESATIDVRSVLLHFWVPHDTGFSAGPVLDTPFGVHAGTATVGGATTHDINCLLQYVTTCRPQSQSLCPVRYQLMSLGHSSH